MDNQNTIIFALALQIVDNVACRRATEKEVLTDQEAHLVMENCIVLLRALLDQEGVKPDGI